MATIYEQIEALEQQVATLQTMITTMQNQGNFITGAVIATNEKLNGKTIYCKTIDFGVLPNATTKTVASGLSMSDIEIVKIDGIARNTANDGTTYQLGSSSPSAQYSISCFVTAGGNVQISTQVDRSDFVGIVRIFYIEKD